MSPQDPRLVELLMKGDLLCDLAMELIAGQTPVAERDVGLVAANALIVLTNAIVRIAALNSDPRQVLEHVVHLIDASDPSTYIDDDDESEEPK